MGKYLGNTFETSSVLNRSEIDTSQQKGEEIPKYVEDEDQNVSINPEKKIEGIQKYDTESDLTNLRIEFNKMKMEILKMKSKVNINFECVEFENRKNRIQIIVSKLIDLIGSEKEMKYKQNISIPIMKEIKDEVEEEKGDDQNAILEHDRDTQVNSELSQYD